jgi:hypothetical protein
MPMGKLSGMDLHQQAARDVKRILAAHGPDLISFRGCLELAVPEAGAYWEEPDNPDFVSIDPCVRTGHVRQWAAGQTARRKTGKPTLRLRVVSFAGLHLYTPDGQRIRTRTRPTSKKTGLPLRATSGMSEPLFEYGPAEPPHRASGGREPLFGHDPVAQPYELSVLMDMDLGTKTLGGAWLAAIDWGSDDKGKAIYYEEEIPPLPMMLNGHGGGTALPPGSEGPAEDGFGDFLADEGEETGTDPA